jgi:hypothetical protein
VHPQPVTIFQTVRHEDLEAFSAASSAARNLI